MNKEEEATSAAFPATIPPELPSNGIKYKNIIRALAITEGVLGIISMAAGSAVTYIVYGAPKARGDIPTYGEGIWSGVWVVVAGAIGIAAGSKKSTYCLIYTHMGFAIVGVIFSIAQLITSVITSIFNFFGASAPFFVIIDVAAIVSMVLLILSASYCCCASSACCQEYGVLPTQTQVVYVTGNPNQYANMQGDPGCSHGYVIQPPQQIMQTQPSEKLSM